MMGLSKYFGTDGIRGRVGKFPIVPEFFFKLGWAVGKVLSGYGLNTVILGIDTRLSSNMLKSALQTGLSYSGVFSMFTGILPTPAVSYFTRVFHSVVGIVISASHNPFYDNGVKFFFIKGLKLSTYIEESIELELRNIVPYVRTVNFGKVSCIIDFIDRYIEFCIGIFPSYLNLKDFKIILDCANGAAYRIAPHVLCELGANIICVGCQPNGMNINKECGATDIRQLQNVVVKEHANLGIAYDGDADRVIMVDHLGNKVDGDQILYIIARDRKCNNLLFGGVVGTEMSNVGLELALKELDIPFVRSCVGDRDVFNMMQKKGWCIGGEQSGHIILLDKMNTGDGIVVCLHVLLVMVSNQISLYDLCRGMRLFPQVLLNIPCFSSRNVLLATVFQETVNEIRNELGNFGRVVLRVSGTEPCIRIMIEGKCYTQVSYLSNKIIKCVRDI